MVLGPGIEVKSVESDPLIANGYFSEIGPDFTIESVAVHAQIERRIPQPNQARRDSEEPFGGGIFHVPSRSTSRSVTTGLRPVCLRT